MGLAHRNLKQYKEAVIAFKKALELKPSSKRYMKDLNRTHSEDSSLDNHLPVEAILMKRLHNYFQNLRLQTKNYLILPVN